MWVGILGAGADSVVWSLRFPEGLTGGANVPMFLSGCTRLSVGPPARGVRGRRRHAEGRLGCATRRAS